MWNALSFAPFCRFLLYSFYRVPNVLKYRHRHLEEPNDMRRTGGGLFFAAEARAWTLWPMKNRPVALLAPLDSKLRSEASSRGEVQLQLFCG